MLFWTINQEHTTVLLCHYLLGALPIAADSCSSQQIEGDDGQIDPTLEEQEEVDAVGGGVCELQSQGI